MDDAFTDRSAVPVWAQLKATIVLYLTWYCVKEVGNFKQSPASIPVA